MKTLPTPFGPTPDHPPRGRGTPAGSAAGPRAALRANLRHVLGPAATDAAVDRAVQGAFRTSAYNYIDMFRIPVVAPDALLQRTTLHHPERFLDTYRRIGMKPFKEAIYG